MIFLDSIHPVTLAIRSSVGLYAVGAASATSALQLCGASLIPRTRMPQWLRTLLIFLGVIDVCYILYEHLKEPPLLLLSVSDIFEVFGAFMVVLIAIEIFINIRLYLGSNTLPIRLVVATALMAIARKVIVLDLNLTSANEVLAIGVVTIALGITYWLVDKPAPVAKPSGAKP